MPISGLGLSRGHSPNHIICSSSHLPHHTVMSFCPFLHDTLTSPDSCDWHSRCCLHQSGPHLPSSCPTPPDHWSFDPTGSCQSPAPAKNAVSTSKFHSQSHSEATNDLHHQEYVGIWGSHSTVAEDSVLLGCYIMSGGIVPRIERNCRDCTQTTTQYHIPEERDLLSQRKCMAYHTIPLHKHKKVMVNKSYHYLQRQNLRYKWMIMICRDGLSQTLRYKWMIMICRDRP